MVDEITWLAVDRQGRRHDGIDHRAHEAWEFRVLFDDLAGGRHGTATLVTELPLAFLVLPFGEVLRLAAGIVT